MSFLFVIVGMFLLVVGANMFVSGASSLASKLKVSPLVIGLTIVAFGTSAPELAVSISSSLSGSNEIVIGNVVGSNIFNLLIVIGCSSLIAPLVIEKTIIKRDWIISIIGTILLLTLVLNDRFVSLIDGVILLLGFCIIFVFQIIKGLKNKDNVTVKIVNQSILKMSLYILVGLLFIISGGKIVVNASCDIAKMFNVSHTIIGLTIVAIGTSLPELVTSVVATIRKENSIAIGNVIGSNIFNIYFILGTTSIINPIEVTNNGIIDICILLGISFTLLIPAKFNKFKIGSGIVMIILYSTYMYYILIR